ncbi:hypothetical protein SAMN06297422_11664 [Lachnospiraceae bacterium]|jgi:hypothetical protein|nr:hypothetical protein SAMN06297422_11664 [Lachnospiraceae bacterium]
MKYSTEEALNEIMKRGALVREKKEKQRTRILTASAFVVGIMLMCVLSIYAGAAARSSESVYGSFLLPAEAGGYVLTAVLAFTLGVIIAVLVRSYRKKNKTDSNKSKDK